MFSVEGEARGCDFCKDRDPRILQKQKEDLGENRRQVHWSICLQPVCWKVGLHSPLAACLPRIKNIIGKKTSSLALSQPPALQTTTWFLGSSISFSPCPPWVPAEAVSQISAPKGKYCCWYRCCSWAHQWAAVCELWMKMGVWAWDPSPHRLNR